MTVAIAGAQTRAGIRIASTFGTPVACGAGDRLVAEITPSFGVNILPSRAIGSGRFMAETFTRGSILPTISVTGDVGFRNNFDTIAALILGTDSVSAMLTAGQNDYRHRITFNTTLNSRYATMAYETSTSTTHEFPSCACTSLTVRSTSVPGFLEYSADFIANTVNLSSATNTNATLANVTNTDTDLAAIDYDDDFWINAQGGVALAGGAQYNVTGFEFNIARPQEFRPEIKGSAGNSAPVGAGLATSTLNITVKELANHAYYTVWSTEAAQKAALICEGPQIGTGSLKTVAIYVPRMLLIQEPQYAITDEGVNTLSMQWNCAAAAANPTGMQSTFPYFEVINGLATTLLP